MAFWKDHHSVVLWRRVLSGELLDCQGMCKGGLGVVFGLPCIYEELGNIGLETVAKVGFRVHK